jgi:hypothetical protein
MGLKKSSSPKRDKLAILFLFSMLNCQQASILGMLKSVPKMKKVINLLCNSKLILKNKKEEEKSKQQSLKLEKIFLLLSFSELLDVQAISKYLIWF